MNDIKQLAEQFGVDESALRCLLTYLFAIIEKMNDEERMYCRDNFAEFMDIGVRKWNELSQKYFTELLTNKEKFDAFASDLYDEIKRKQA